MSNSELAYWKDKAALLDPAAYRFYNSNDDGPSWSFTVPAGEVWYLVNAWYVISDTSNAFMFQRLLDVNAAVPLTPGTTIKANGSQGAYAYVCKPSTVFDDERYDTPDALYYDRLHKIRSLQLHEKTVTVPAGTARGTNLQESFPSDFENGLLLGVSVNDTSWLALVSPFGAMNTQDEISDDHQMRLARGIMCPFKRSTFTGIRTRSASVSGNSSDSSVDGTCGVRYVKLPLDW